MAGVASSPWSISRFTGVCADSGARILSGAEYVAALCESDGPEGVQRVDYSAGAWDAGARPPRLFAFWRASAPTREGQRSPLVSDDELLSLFESVIDSGDEDRARFRFLLCLILLRKRLLRHDSTETRPNGRVMIVRRRGEPKEGPAIEVPDPRLSESDAADAAAELAQALRGEA
jgi:hypothetical protein